MTRAGIIRLLLQKNADALYARAYRARVKYAGEKLYLRGLIEISNVCEKNCFYCGIRRGNKKLSRYAMAESEIISAAIFAHRRKMGSVVIQAGERRDAAFSDMIERCLSQIRLRTGGELAVTLSLGEQDEAVYRRWFLAGARRYLLRIETSNERLYKKLHPKDHSFAKRLDCLSSLRKTGYQVGTGVMTGLPGQTVEDLADDILFFKRIDADMIGMGPYVPHADTPLSAKIDREKQLETALRMIAATRLVLKDVNIASATALDALASDGRERGIKAGANVLMPNITPAKYRSRYRLYDGKPCLNEDAEKCGACLERRLKASGEEIAHSDPGDAKHYLRRV